MSISREHATLKKQYEVQSAQFAAILTELQQLTMQLEEERATTQARIDEAVAESRHALRAAERARAWSHE